MPKTLFAKFFVYLFIALFSLPALAKSPPDMTVFGITLGQPLAVDECPQGTVSFKAMCAMKDRFMPKDEYGVEFVDVWFPTSFTSELVSSGSLSVILIDGSVESVTFGTWSGDMRQQMALRELTKKYGRPIIF